MPSARRLYVYLISGVSLGLLVVGLDSLIRIALGALGLGSGQIVLIGEASASEELSGALALVAVGAPVWLIHWGWIERGLQPSRPTAEDERASGLRAFYLTVWLFVFLVPGAAAASSLITMAMTIAGGGDPRDLGPGTTAAAVATLVVTALAWGYHAAIRRRDLSAGPLTEASAWLPRAYVYGAAFGGIVALTAGLTELVFSAVTAVFGGEQVISKTGGPDLGLAAAVGTTVGAAAVWLGHYGYAEWLLQGPGWRGATERPSLLRLAFFVLVFAFTAQSALTELAFVGGVAMGAVLDSLGPGSDVVTLVAGHTILALLFGAGAAFHITWMRTDAGSLADPGRLAAVWRLERYVLALTGLGFAAGGVVALISITVRAAAGRVAIGSGTDPLAAELASAVPYVVVGTLVWSLSWAQVIRRTAADPVVEAASAVRRISLLAVLALSVVAGVIALAIVLYHLFVSLLDGNLSGSAVAQMGVPLGVVVVAVVAGVYHGALLRHDVALVPRQAAPEPPAPAAAPAQPETPSTAIPDPAASAEAAATEGGPVIPEGVSLTLRGPDGADLDAALEAARSSLPEGYRLERD